MKVLTFTSLFPNSIQTRHGIFVENRLKHLRQKFPGVDISVVAPVPWFPFKHPMFGDFSTYAKVEKLADRGWAKVIYPRYPVIPRIGMSLAPWLMAIACYPKIKRIIRQGFDFDILDAHYFYPDGAAAMLIAGWLNKPLICTARGNDITLLPNFRIPRKLIGNTVKSCATVITVCRALQEEIERLGYHAKRIEVLRNGVDLDLFRPARDRRAARQLLGLKKFTILSVGHHLERKGHHLVIEAMQSLPDCELLIAGDGPMKKKLESLTRKLKLVDRVRFLGAVEHHDLPAYYAGADILVLASSREGWANVLLEAMACGTPVVATNIWGTPEIIKSPDAGVLVERTPESILAGINQLRNDRPDRECTRVYAEHFSWDDTSDKLYELLCGIVAKN